MNNSQVAVVILNYQSWNDTLEEALAVKRLFSFDCSQIIVVDNNSQNDSARIFKTKEKGNFVFLESKHNGGYASGNNIGLKYARNKGFKYCWILNNDILFKDNRVLDVMLSVFYKEPSVAVVNPDVYSPCGYLYNRDSTRMNFWDFTLGIFCYKKKGRNICDKGGYGYVYRPQGCCMLVDLQKLEFIDYLDEKTFLYCEELILAEKLLKKGLRCACATTVSIVHNHSKTVKSTFARFKILSIQNESFNYYLKEYRNYKIFKRIICSAFFLLKNLLLN